MKPDTIPRIAWWRRAVLRLFRVEVRYGTVARRLASADHRPLIVACNHQSLLDGPILAFASPRPMVFPVTTAHAARRGLAVLEGLGLGRVVALDADHPWRLRSLVTALRTGQPVAIFPEGKLGDPEVHTPDQGGMSWLCERTGAEVVRARIAGAGDSRLFGKKGTRIWPRITLDF